MRHTGFLVTRLPPRKPSPQEFFRVAALLSSLTTKSTSTEGRTHGTTNSEASNAHTRASAGKRQGTPDSFLALHFLPATESGHGASPRPRRRRRRRRRRRQDGSVAGLRSWGPRRQTGSRPSPPREHRAAHTNPACIKSDLLMTKVTTQRLPRASRVSRGRGRGGGREGGRGLRRAVLTTRALAWHAAYDTWHSNTLSWLRRAAYSVPECGLPPPSVPRSTLAPGHECDHGVTSLRSRGCPLPTPFARPARSHVPSSSPLPLHAPSSPPSLSLSRDRYIPSATPSLSAPSPAHPRAHLGTFPTLHNTPS